MVVLLGLSDAPSTFQRLMTIVLQQAFIYFYTVYLDDILMYLSSIAKHLQYIEWVLFKLRSNYLFAKPTNYEFGLTKLEYFGYILSSGTVNPYSKKTEAI